MRLNNFWRSIAAVFLFHLSICHAALVCDSSSTPQQFGALKITHLCNGDVLDNIFPTPHYTYEIYKVEKPRPDQSGITDILYLQWVPSKGAKRPAGVVHVPYYIIDWGSYTAPNAPFRTLLDPKELPWLDRATGPQEDYDGPFYKPGVSSQMYLPRQAADLYLDNIATRVYLAHDVSVLNVFARFYVGGDAINEANEIQIGFEFLATRNNVDMSKIGFESGSWGGLAGLYGSLSNIRPRVASYYSPMIDFQALDKNVTDATAGLTLEQALLFGDPNKTVAEREPAVRAEMAKNPALAQKLNGLTYEQADAFLQGVRRVLLYLDPYFRRVQASIPPGQETSPDRFAAFSAQALFNPPSGNGYNTESIIAVDDLDTVTPYNIYKQSVALAPSGKIFTYHSTHAVSQFQPIDINNRDVMVLIGQNKLAMGHEQPGYEMNGNGLMPWARVFMMNRLMEHEIAVDPAAKIVIPVDVPAFVDVNLKLTQMPDATWARPLYKELCAPRVEFYDIASPTRATGPQVLASLMVNVWKRPDMGDPGTVCQQLDAFDFKLH